MKLIKQQVFVFFFNKDTEDIKEEVNGFRKENCPVNLLMFECTFRTGSSFTVDGEAAQSTQLIALSRDLECVTQRIRDSFLYPAFHFSKSFHTQHLIQSTFFFLVFFFFFFFFFVGFEVI